MLDRPVTVEDSRKSRDNAIIFFIRALFHAQPNDLCNSKNLAATSSSFPDAHSASELIELEYVRKSVQIGEEYLGSVLHVFAQWNGKRFARIYSWRDALCRLRLPSGHAETCPSIHSLEGRTMLGPYFCLSLMPFQHVQFALKWSIISILHKTFSNGILGDVFPFESLLFPTSKLCIPGRFLPDRLFVDPWP